MKPLVLAAVAAVALTGPAHASIIPILGSVTADGSDFKFNYTGRLEGTEGVKAGNQLVIVDFAGYVPGSVFSTLADVSASTSASLPAGLLLAPGVLDSAAIPDLVFTYTGADFHTTGGPYPGWTDFSGIGALSTIGTVQGGSYSSVTVKNFPQLEGSPVFTEGQVNVPGIGAVPEPATWAMMLLGFAGLGGLLRRRARSAPMIAA